MEPDKTVLVVVDVQNGFVGSRSRHIVPVIVDLVHRWQACGGSNDLLSVPQLSRQPV